MYVGSDQHAYVNTPPSERTERERKKKNKRKENSNQRSRNRKAKDITVLRKKRKWKSFHKDVGRHIASRYPTSGKRGLDLEKPKLL